MAADVYLDAALDIARWIEGASVRGERGTAWLADPRDASSAATNLYSGGAGIVLFFLELHLATGDARYLDEARDGRRRRAPGLDRDAATGLYTGIAGLGFALGELARIGGAREDQDGCQRAVTLLVERAHSIGRGVEWNETTDIVGGSAGTGLFLLYAARRCGDARARALAEAAAARLVELGTADGATMEWRMDRT